MPKVGEIRAGVPLPAELVRARRARRKAAGVPWYPYGIATCRRKKRHGGEGTAEAEAERLEIASPAYEYNHYRCRFCGDWHVGRVKGDPL